MQELRLIQHRATSQPSTESQGAAYRSIQLALVWTFNVVALMFLAATIITLMTGIA